MRKFRPLEWLLAVALLLVIGAIVFPVFSGSYSSIASTCLSNVKQSSLALILYTSDENDRYPPRDFWMDATFPYSKNEGIWHCPSVPKGVYGYAFDGALSGAKSAKLPDPARTPMVYDSVNPIRNASDLCASLPLPGRHGRNREDQPGRNTVGYADGHVKSVTAQAVVH